MTIAVAISGGVDSLLSLKLLQEQGYKVIALHAFFQEPDAEMHRVSTELRKKCEYLGIPFQLLDLAKEFKELVVEPFVNSYIQGLTPNPCALCNRRMKFGIILERALDLGADRLATGHYASQGCISGQNALFRGSDKDKEQSYFLSLLTASQLQYACFPLANWRKADTYRALHERSLDRVSKQESQEICFIPGNDYRKFILDRLESPPPPGPVMDTQGNVLGTHQGLYKYTIGQRRGLGISYSEPLYVVQKYPGDNILVVGTKRECVSNSCRVGDLNILLDYMHWPDLVYVQTRYRQEASPAGIRKQGNEIEVLFGEPRKPATPGQIAAFYSEQGEVLAAGIIHA
ncbi:MAG: tRNA 2-thiouridine(34) synthase MnmA [Thermodesulfobacteriota bacterium]